MLTGKIRTYIATERLSNFCYKMRKERDEANDIIQFVHLISTCYGDKELEVIVSSSLRYTLIVSLNRMKISTQVVMNLYASGDTLGELVAFLEDSVASEDLEFQARSLVNQAAIRLILEDWSGAVAAAEDVVRTGGESRNEILQEAVARALLLKADGLRHLKDLDGARSALEEVTSRCAVVENEEIQIHVVTALSRVALLLASLMRPSEALDVSHRAESALDAISNAKVGPLAYQIRWARTVALFAKGSSPEAWDSLRTAYEMFDSGNRTMLRDMQALVPELVAMGVSPSRIAEVLTSDSQKAGALQPLVIAVVQAAGESIRAPAEVLDVAADISARMRMRAGHLGVS